MIIKSERTLAIFRGPGQCGYCGKWNQYREAAHVIPRSRGRQDVVHNLIALGWAFGCQCHHAEHNGKEPTERQLLIVVAAREGRTLEELIREHQRVCCIPKGGRYVPFSGRKARNQRGHVPSGKAVSRSLGSVIGSEADEGWIALE